MKLRKDQRHVAYIILRDAFERGEIKTYTDGIWDLLNAPGGQHITILKLPELRIGLCAAIFWKGPLNTAKRIAILDQCIKETA